MRNTDLTVRPIRNHDTDSVLALINTDRIDGQPEATTESLSEAIAGRSPVDSGWWEELQHPVAVDVLEDSDGNLVGAVSYAIRPRDRTGLILWLHGREQQEVVEDLIDHALMQMPSAPVVEAFGIASALGLGLEALPIRHRPVTAGALGSRGFARDDLWRYMQRDLPALELPRIDRLIVRESDRSGRKLEVRAEDGGVVAEAEVGFPVGGVGVLWWIEVKAAARGRGLGRAMLGSALDLLAQSGAEKVILYVDDDEPGGARDRTAANRLYESAGFVEVDRLHSFRLTR